MRHYVSQTHLLTIIRVALIERVTENSQGHRVRGGPNKQLIKLEGAHLYSLSRGPKTRREAETTQIMGWSGKEPPPNSVMSMSLCIKRTLAAH